MISLFLMFATIAGLASVVALMQLGVVALVARLERAEAAEPPERFEVSIPSNRVVVRAKSPASANDAWRVEVSAP